MQEGFGGIELLSRTCVSAKGSSDEGAKGEISPDGTRQGDASPTSRDASATPCGQGRYRGVHESYTLLSSLPWQGLDGGPQRDIKTRVSK